MHVIEVEGLSKVFRGRTAVGSLDLWIQAGEIYGFLGPNGAGKTTTIRMLTGILSPSGGHARVAGRDLRADPVGVRGCIGLLPESTGYYEWMTALEYLRFFADLHGLRPAEARDRVRELLRQVGLAERQQTPIATFSRGMRARLGVARALVHRPPVLFLDEPTLGLDPLGQRDVRQLIREINRVEGTTVFLSSHALDQVGDLCTRVGILHEGHLVAQGTAAELARRLALPSTVRVAVADAERAAHLTRGLGGYATGRVLDETHLTLTPEVGPAQTDTLVRTLVEAGLAVHEVVIHAPSLEDVFFALVQRHPEVT